MLAPIIQKLIFNRKSFSKIVKSMFGRRYAARVSQEELDAHWNLFAYQNGNDLLRVQREYVIDRLAHRDAYVQATVEAVKRMPLLHINAPGDTLTGRAMGEKFMEVLGSLPNAELVYLGGEIGHYPHVEDAANVGRLIDDFIQKHRK
jgi:pimeloyl-ACP methyl ester carboxylesterase